MKPATEINAIISAYLELSSAIISDAMDMAGIHGTIEGVFSQVPGRKMCGPAFTVRYTMATTTNNRFADFMDDIPTGAVVAIDNSGRSNCSVWGDTLSLFATRRRYAGTIIDGVCRDIDGTRALNYPMFSRGTFMRTGKGRIAVESTQESIVLGTIVVQPGDLIFGDDTGAVAIPRDRAGEILELTRKIAARDRAFVESIESGASIAQVWAAGAKA